MGERGLGCANGVAVNPAPRSSLESCLAAVPFPEEPGLGAGLAGALGIDPIAAAQAKLKRNAQKYPVDLARGSSAKYDQL